MLLLGWLGALPPLLPEKDEDPLGNEEEEGGWEDDDGMAA